MGEHRKTRALIEAVRSDLAYRMIQEHYAAKYHEVSHAVAYEAVGLDVKSCSVEKGAGGLTELVFPIQVFAHTAERHIMVCLAGRVGEQRFVETEWGGSATGDLEAARRFASLIADPVDRATVWFRATRRAEQLVEDYRDTIEFLVNRWNEADENLWDGEPFDCLPGFEVRLAMGRSEEHDCTRGAANRRNPGTSSTNKSRVLTERRIENGT